MPRFFMHLRNGTDRLIDPEGVIMSKAAVPKAALRAARDCMVGDLRDGQIDFKYRIEVCDGSGTLVHTLEFADAVQIIPAG